MENEKSLQIFNYQGKTVRTVVVNGVVWFFATDVCAFLGLKNVSQATSRVKEKHKCVLTIGKELNNNTIMSSESIPGNPNKLGIDEPGVYQLIFASRKAEAETFQDWIYEDVLPSIRKTGSYSIQPAPILPSALSKHAQANEDRVPHHLFDLGCELTRELPGHPNFRSAQLPDDADLLNSVRQGFWNDRHKLGIPDEARVQYNHVTPSGRVIKAYAYSIEYLHNFRQWLHKNYLEERFLVYLRNRARRIALHPKQKQIRVSDVHLLSRRGVA